MNHISKNELELVEYVRCTFNRAYNQESEVHFTATEAVKIYELIKLLMSREPQTIICPSCREKTENWVCPCKTCTSQDGL